MDACADTVTLPAKHARAAKTKLDAAAVVATHAT
jgi:hypothetical protein